MKGMTDAQVMIQRAHVCADRFKVMGRDFSAAITRGFAKDIESGSPARLYAHWINGQEALADMHERGA